MTGSKKMGLVGWEPINKEDLEFILELIEAGKVVPIIDRCFPLSEAAETLRYFEEGYPRGKVVIIVENNSKS
jgi:NADPH:quinone reductase-like Zn-dependent oxidoreductase